eukprot:TRINITY_DN14706_c0_g1_i1.p1 TRINITY_DN14706_c0_g1~~TRINITY_DN14706_c0_g1_i1.p1  ORF type:complete len:421 (+),score=104.73 TRINITY_DN14706_c0_g1_i1:44-1264(+)
MQAAVLLTALASRCDFRRIPAGADLTDVAESKEPLLVEGAWSDARDDFREKLEAAQAGCGEWLVSLPAGGLSSKRKLGDETVLTARPQYLADLGKPPPGRAGRRDRCPHRTLRAVLFDYNYTDSDPWAVFDRSGLLDRTAPTLQTLLRFDTALRAAPWPYPTVLSAGHAGSGLPFHWHVASASMQICGSKEWHVYPPGQVPPGGYNAAEPHSIWAADVLPTLNEDDRPLVCFQNANEMVLVPAGWRHATVNVDPSGGHSVSVALQNWGQDSTDSSESTPDWFKQFDRGVRYSQDKEHELAMEALQMAVKLLPSEPALWFELARSQLFLAEEESDAELKAEMLKSLQVAYDLNPLDWRVASALRQSLRASGREREASSLDSRMQAAGLVDPSRMYPRSSQRGASDEL